MSEDERTNLDERRAAAFAHLEYLVERRRLAQARAQLAELLPQHPQDTELLFYSGYVDYLDDRYDGARKSLRQALAREPEHAAASYILYLVEYEKGHYAEAEELILGLLRSYPESSEYLAAYAQLMLTTGHLEKADKLAREAARLEPDNHRALIVGAVSAFVSAPTAEARENLTRLVERYPESLATMATTMTLLANQRRHKEALELAQELIRVDPSNQAWVEAIVDLKAATHWSMVPLWPMVRFGWAGSAAIWVAWILLYRLLPNTPLAPYTGVIVVGFLAYIIYSWTWPHLLKKILR